MSASAPPNVLKRSLDSIVYRQPGFWSIFLAFLGIFLLFQPVEYLTTDSAVRDFVAHNLVYEGDLALIQVEAGGYLNNLYTYGRGERPYTYFGIGQSLMEIPFIVALEGLDRLGLRRHLEPSRFLPQSAVMVISSALLIAFLFGLTRLLGYRRSSAYRVALLAGFASIVWGLSRQAFDMMQETMAVVGALYFVLLALSDKPRRALYCLLAGAIFGVGLITRISTVVAGPALALLVLGSDWGGTRQKVRSTLWCLLGGLPFALWIPIYNIIRFESIFEFGYTGHRPIPGGPILAGLGRWLLSPWTGALVYMPLLWLLPIFLPRFLQDRKLFGGVLALLFVAYLFFLAQYEGLGMFGWGAYYLLPGVIPLYVVFAEFFEDPAAFPRWQRAAMTVLTVLTVAIQLPSLTLPNEYNQSLMAANGVALTQQQLMWDLHWNPIRNLTAGSIRAYGNLPHWQDYMHTPRSFDAQSLLDGFYSYNLPDWWWLYHLFKGGESSLVVPLIALLSALWLLTLSRNSRLESV